MLSIVIIDRSTPDLVFGRLNTLPMRKRNGRIDNFVYAMASSRLSMKQETIQMENYSGN